MSYDLLLNAVKWFLETISFFNLISNLFLLFFLLFSPVLFPLSPLPPVFLVTGNEVANADLSLPKEQIITSLQDGRLNLNDSLSIEDVQLSHGLINLHNLNTLSTLDFEFDDALEDIHILNAVANSINEWKLRKHAKNASSNGVNKKRVKRYEYSGIL